MYDEPELYLKQYPDGHWWVGVQGDWHRLGCRGAFVPNTGDIAADFNAAYATLMHFAERLRASLAPEPSHDA